MSYIDIEWLLLIAAIFTSAIALLDRFVLAKHRGQIATPTWIVKCHHSYPWFIFFWLVVLLGFSTSPQMGITIFDFPLILTLTVILSGIIVLADVCWFAKKRKAKGQTKASSVIESARSFFPVLLLVLVIRSFIAQPFHVPTGSLEPTVLPGDFVFTNQFIYGLRLPVINTKIIPITEPKRGDIVVLRWPVDPQVDFVKRVIGLPGDHIIYKNKQLIINGIPATLTPVGPGIDEEPGENITVMQYQEDLLGVKHDILINPYSPGTGDADITVPPNHYFMMGDNRDNSDDSRTWGFVPEANIVGKAEFIIISFNPQSHHFRWNRTWQWLH